MRDYYKDFQDLQQQLLESEDADLAASEAMPAAPAIKDPSLETPQPEQVRGEVQINGRNMNAVLADLLEKT